MKKLILVSILALLAFVAQAQQTACKEPSDKSAYSIAPNSGFDYDVRSEWGLKGSDGMVRMTTILYEGYSYIISLACDAPTQGAFKVTDSASGEALFTDVTGVVTKGIRFTCKDSRTVDISVALTEPSDGCYGLMVEKQGN